MMDLAKAEWVDQWEDEADRRRRRRWMWRIAVGAVIVMVAILS